MAQDTALSKEEFTAAVKQARGGDADAFGKLYRTVYRELYYVARSALRSEADAADAVSDAVLDAFRTIGKLRDEAAFRAWIFKILAAKIKQKQRDYAQAPAAVDDVTEQNLPSSDFSFVSSEVRTALQTLSTEDRMLLTMQVLGGYQSRELAGMIGSTDTAVRSKLTRIRAKLRELLSEPENGREQYA